MNYQCGHSIGRHHETAADGYPICPKCLHVERDKLRAENANLKSKRHITLTQAREQALFNIERSRERAKWADTQAENAELKEEQAQWDMAHPYNLRCRGKTKDEFNERLLSLLPSDFPLKAENVKLKKDIKDYQLVLAAAKPANAAFEAENATLKEALKAWQLMDSESYDKNKAPCHIMRAEYRRSARELTEQVLKE